MSVGVILMHIVFLLFCVAFLAFGEEPRGLGGGGWRAMGVGVRRGRPDGRSPPNTRCIRRRKRGGITYQSVV